MLQLYYLSDLPVKNGTYLGENFGFIDSYNNYIFKIENTMSSDIENPTLNEFKKLYSAKDCLVILHNLVLQCFWSEVDVITFTRAKIKLCAIPYDSIDDFVDKTLSSYLDIKVSELQEYVYNIILTICEEAKVKDIEPKFR